MKRDPYDIILEPLVTEKFSSEEGGKKQVAFRVRQDATKPEIRRAVTALFGDKKVEVKKVRTMICKGKTKRMGRNLRKMPDYKKALVSLKGEGSIELFEAS